MPWVVVLTSTFKRGYKKKNANLQSKVEECIKLISNSANPRDQGRKKHGALRETYGYDIDSGNRILYAVDDSNKEIYLLRVCSHKEVYGTQ